MLIKCPRCGFSQPQDHYCASCGVNIEKYVPRKQSLWRKIFSNTLSQVTLVTVISLGASYYALRSSDSSSPQVSRRKVIQQTLSNSSLSATTDAARPEIAGPGESLESTNHKSDVSVELQSEEQRDRLSGAAHTNELSARMVENPNLKTVAVSASLPATTASAVAATFPSVVIKVSYYEVSRTVLSYWIQKSGAGSDNEAAFNAGVINRKLFDDQIRYAALKTESTKTNLNTKANFKSESNKDGVMLGLESEIFMNSLNSGSITITKTTSQGTDNIRTFINLPPDNVFFIHWKNDLVGLQNEADLSEVPPFQILKSRQFLVKKTELVMIIESLK